MVKILQSLMKGGVARIIKKVINSKFPKPFGWLAGERQKVYLSLFQFLIFHLCSKLFSRHSRELSISHNLHSDKQVQCQREVPESSLMDLCTI